MLINQNISSKVLARVYELLTHGVLIVYHVIHDFLLVEESSCPTGILLITLIMIELLFYQEGHLVRQVNIVTYNVHNRER